MSIHAIISAPPLVASLGRHCNLVDGSCGIALCGFLSEQLIQITPSFIDRSLHSDNSKPRFQIKSLMYIPLVVG